MAEINPCGWLQNAGATHTAQQMRLFLGSLLTGLSVGNSLACRGGVHPIFGGKLLVQQNGTPNMSVNVSGGAAYIPGTESITQGVYFCGVDATVNLSITTAPGAGLNRIDLVVFKVQDSFYSGATNASSLAVVTGTAAASPSAPTAPANSIILAQVFVGALVTSITTANITDTRIYAAGLMGVLPCLSGSRPSSSLIIPGQFIYETDTKLVRFWDGSAWQAISLSSGAHVESATTGTTTSTTYITSLTTAGVMGVAFVAPPSGIVKIDWAAAQFNSGLGYSLSSVQVKNGNVVDSGTTFFAANDNDIIQSDNNATGVLRAGVSTLITGLTVGNSYNVCMAHRVASGTGSFLRRRIIVTPWQ